MEEPATGLMEHSNRRKPCTKYLFSFIALLFLDFQFREFICQCCLITIFPHDSSITFVGNIHVLPYFRTADKEHRRAFCGSIYFDDPASDFDSSIL